jgi:hypothetical protein
MYQFLDEQDMCTLVEKNPKETGCLKNIINKIVKSYFSQSEW